MRNSLSVIFFPLLTACSEPIVNWGNGESSLQVMAQADEARCNYIAQVTGQGVRSTGGLFTLRPPTNAEDDARRDLMSKAEKSGGNALVWEQQPQSTDNGATATAVANAYYCQ